MDTPTTASEPPAATTTLRAATAPPRRYLAGAVPFAILAIALGLIALFVVRWDSWVGASSRQTTDDAYVRADITPLSAKVEGIVREVPVTDYQRVHAGDLLVRIEDADYQARVAQAEANLLGATAAVENLKAHKAQQHALIAEAEQAILATQADVERTRLEADRQRALVATTFGTQQRLEQAVAEQRRFAATLARNQAELDSQRRAMAVLDTQESQLRAELKAKKAALDLAQIDLGYAQIRAPVDGMVGERDVRVGQYAHVGTQVIAVVPLDTVWVVANYKETQLTNVQLGQRAEVRVDSFPGVVLTGRVDSVAPASGSQFSLLAPDNATGNFTKVVQRIPVKITIDPGQALAGRLRPGMSAIATVLTDRTAQP